MKYEPYHALINAIILQAVKDYRTALDDENTSGIAECERFFRSDWFTFLTDVDGEIIIRQVKREITRRRLKEVLSVTEIYRGDIYYIMPFYTVTGSEQRAGRPGVVVSNDINNRHSPNVEIVFLTSQEKKPLPTHVPVMCRVPSTALCENIQTVSKERLSTFIKSCTTKELKNIDNALLVSLGINSPFPVGGD